jgi:hypothetical protein
MNSNIVNLNLGTKVSHHATVFFVLNFQPKQLVLFSRLYFLFSDLVIFARRNVRKWRSISEQEFILI